MGKALIAGMHGLTLVTGEEWLLGMAFNGATEAQSQYQATEQATFSGLRGVIASGGSGTNTFRFRNNGADGNQVQAVVGAVAFEDTTNSDTVSAGNTFNGGYTDTGTDSLVRTIAVNVAFASGHGNFHTVSGAANVVMDVASSTRYLPIQGACAADGTATIANAQYKVREYTSIEAFQVRINANARLNNSVFSVNVNGVDTGTAITFATTVTGLQVVTGMGISLSPGDLVCISMTLGTGVEDLSFGFAGVTMKSTANASAAGFGTQAGSARAASATPDYYSFGTGGSTTETSTAVKVGFAARCTNLRCYLSANTYTGAATLKLMVNGAAVLTTTITASGGAGWYENTTDTANIDADDVVSFEIDEGTSGSITIHQIWITFGPLIMDADSATYSYTATDAALSRGMPIDADSAAYAYTASDADLTYTPVGGATYSIDAAAAAYLWTASDTSLEFGRQIEAETTAYTWTAQDATLELGRLLDADAAVYNWTADSAGFTYSGVPVAPDIPAAPALGGIGHKRRRRRIRLDDGSIWEPASEADFQDYIASLIRSLEAKLPPPLEPPAKPRKRRYKAAVKSLAEIPRLMLRQPLPAGFYEALANNHANVLNSHLLAQAWADYLAEVEEDEDVTMLLLS